MTNPISPIDRRVVPPVYFLTAILVMAALHWSLPFGAAIPAPFSYAGALLIAAGLAVVVVAARLFQKHDTAVRPFEASTALVTEGVYRYTRNPMYLGMVVILTGIAVLLGTLASFLPVPVFVWLIQKRFILKEEALLDDTFGERYSKYRQSVRRWI